MVGRDHQSDARNPRIRERAQYVIEKRVAVQGHHRLHAGLARTLLLRSQLRRWIGRAHSRAEPAGQHDRAFGHSSSPGGFAPPGPPPPPPPGPPPPPPPPRGAPTPHSAPAGAPVARLDVSRRRVRGASPPRPPHASARGAPTPRSAPAG